MHLDNFFICIRVLRNYKNIFWKCHSTLNNKQTSKDLEQEINLPKGAFKDESEQVV